MNKLKLLIVEGNTKEENINFNSAGCVPQSQNFKLHIEKLESNSEIDIVEPGNDKSVSKIISSLKKYDGVVLTGSTLRIADTTAAGGKCRVAPKGAHVGIAYDIELTNEGKKHKLFNSKPHKFTTPAFNYDEVEIPPNNAVLLASNKINKFEALHFTVGNSDIWGLQYHPEIPYDYMIKLIEKRSRGLIDKNVFKNKNEISQHIDSIKKAETKLSDDIRTLELKNWLDYLRKI